MKDECVCRRKRCRKCNACIRKHCVCEFGEGLCGCVDKKCLGCKSCINHCSCKSIDVQLVSESKRIKLEKTNSTSTNPSTNSSAQNSPPSLNSPTSTQSSFISEGITRCICEFDGDDGVMIECEDCKDWFHTCCVGVDENRLPEKYICPKCQGIPQPHYVIRWPATAKQNNSNWEQICGLIAKPQEPSTLQSLLSIDVDYAMYYIKNRTSEVYYPQNEYLLQAQHEKILAKKSHVSKLKRLIATLQRDLEKLEDEVEEDLCNIVKENEKILLSIEELENS